MTRARRMGATAMATAALALTAAGDADAAIAQKFSAPYWHACSELRGTVAPTLTCAHTQSLPLGRVDDAGTVSSRVLLHGATLTLPQTSMIQEASVRLQVISGEGTIAVHRITASWSPNTPEQTPPPFDPIPVMTAAAAPGQVEIDITWLADEWARSYLTGGESGLYDQGILIRVLDEDGSECAGARCPQLQVAGAAHPTAELRPRTATVSWPAAPFWTTQTFADRDPGAGTVHLHTTVRPTSPVTTARFQYLHGARSVWRDVPLGHMRDAYGGAIAGVDLPFTPPRTGVHRWAEAVWDATATLGSSATGLVRVRAIHAAPPETYEQGATLEVGFTIPAPVAASPEDDPPAAVVDPEPVRDPAADDGNDQRVVVADPPTAAYDPPLAPVPPPASLHGPPQAAPTAPVHAADGPRTESAPRAGRRAAARKARRKKARKGPLSGCRAVSDKRGTAGGSRRVAAGRRGRDKRKPSARAVRCRR